MKLFSSLTSGSFSSKKPDPTQFKLKLKNETIEFTPPDETSRFKWIETLEFWIGLQEFYYSQRESINSGLFVGVPLTTISHILSFLQFKDLLNVRLVCTKWNKISTIILRTRVEKNWSTPSFPEYQIKNIPIGEPKTLSLLVLDPPKGFLTTCGSNWRKWKNLYIPIEEAKGHKENITKIITDYNQTVVTSSNDKTVKIWNWNSLSCLKTLKHSANVTCISFFAGDKLLSGSDELAEWDFSGKKIRSMKSQVTTMLEDQNIVWTTSDDLSLRIWDLRQSKPIAASWKTETPVNHLVKHGNWIIGAETKRIKLWDISAGRIVHSFDVDAPISALSSVNKTLLVGTVTGSVLVYRAPFTSLHFQRQEHTGEIYSIGLTTLFPGSNLATTGADGLLKIWSFF